MDPIRPVDREILPPVHRIERRTGDGEAREREERRRRRAGGEPHAGRRDAPDAAGGDDDDEPRPRIDVRA